MNIPSNEYAPFYAGYVSQVNNQDILEVLQLQSQELEQLFSSLSEEQGLFAYADGKWTLKELLGHLNDAERVFSYRLFRIGRGDQTPLPGFEQDDYIETALSNQRTIQSLIEEFKGIRAATLSLIDSLSDEDLLRKGTASNTPVSVRALMAITAGHVKHHLVIIKERYLPNL